MTATPLVEDRRHLLTASEDFWDTCDDDNNWRSMTSDDVQLPWFQSYYDQQLQLQLTPPTDTSSAHSNNSSVSFRVNI